jgi:hypothetical protein
MTASHHRRTTTSRVEWLAERCNARDTAILWTLNRLRLATGLHLERLHFADLAGRSRAVTRWRVLKRLTDWGLIAPLERRVGGSARGSVGMVYTLDSAGARLLRLTEHQDDRRRIRRPITPGERKVKHSLAVAELYTALAARSRTLGFALARFDVEPSYATGTGWLSPDAYAVLTVGDVADHWWIEVDRATESLPTVRRKIEAYSAYYQQGRWAGLGIMPRVLVTVPDERRQTQLRDSLQPEAVIFTTIEMQATAADYVALTLTNSHR